MRIVIAFIRASFHSSTIYRFDFWLSLLSVVLMMYANHSIWYSLYQQNPQAFGISREYMSTYGVLASLLIPIMNTATFTQTYIAQQVRAGMLEIDLMKPLDFHFHMFCRNLGEACVKTVTVVLPSLLIAILFLDFRPPVSLLAGLESLVSLVLGYFVFFGINLLMGVLAVITLDIRSYNWVFLSVVRFASGQFVPLWMFPPVLVGILSFLPFKDVFFVPLSIYIGAYRENILTALLTQFGWAVGLLAATRMIWLRVKRQITVQGG